MATMQKLVEAIHGSGRLAVAAITGGGSGAIGMLLEQPGGSRTVLEAIVPYAPASLHAWLGGAPNQACSAATARAMATAAWLRAAQLAPAADRGSLVGVGCTASLATDRAKRGDHRIHVAAHTDQAAFAMSLVLAKEARSRAEEECLAQQMVLLAMAAEGGNAADAARRALEAELVEEEVIAVEQESSAAPWADLWTGRLAVHVLPGADERRAVEGVVFPGAFNPLHQGHLQMAEVAEQRTGNRVAWEISLRNVDKPPLDWITVCRRRDQIRRSDAARPIALTTAASFVEKAALWPGATFVVGADTIGRIGDSHYYDNDDDARDRTLAEIAETGCRFLVFGRVTDGAFRTLGDLKLPETLSDIADEVKGDAFRVDISSTELRA